MDDSTALTFAVISAVVAVGGTVLTGWGTRGAWKVLLVAAVVFVALASAHEYATNQAR